MAHIAVYPTWYIFDLLFKNINLLLSYNNRQSWFKFKDYQIIFHSQMRATHL